MPRVRSFPPIENARARVLILGSMPGGASLAAGQYYAHPQNLFWRIMCNLLGANIELPYRSRLALLKSNRIALWDVLEFCEREGSLDSAIDDNSIVVNDFVSFFRTHRHVTHVFFNGAKAESSYRRHVLLAHGGELGPLEYCRLPSTSPAHAAKSYEEKRKAWRRVVVKGQS